VAPEIELLIATADNAPEIAILRTAAADELSRQFGHGHWSSAITVKNVLRSLKHARVVIGRANGAIVGTLRLAPKRPWAIDPRYFAVVERPLHLTDMAVAPDRQREGIGRLLIAHAKEIALAWPAGSIRLDAYDGLAGAGPFYARCGFAEVGRVAYRGVPLIYYEWKAREVQDLKGT
jgi:GNAT superfamily N-acetyltransferase